MVGILALNGVDLTIKEGEFVSIIGPSGSGKSTLLNIIGALDLPDSGSIQVAGYDLLSNKKLNEFRGEQLVLFSNFIILFLIYLLLKMLKFQCLQWDYLQMI